MLTYYKLIDIEHYDTIVEKCLSHVKKNDEIYHRKITNVSWYNLNVQELKRDCPELQEAFLKYNLYIVLTAVYVMWQPTHSGIHADDYFTDARINLPLLNCKNTYTNFYKSNKPLKKWVSPSSRPAFLPDWSGGPPTLIDKVEMTQATVLRTKELHSVYMPEGNPVPRITLTLGFNKDPVYLLD